MKRKHSTIKLEATGKHTNTRKHTKKVKLHQNLCTCVNLLKYVSSSSNIPLNYVHLTIG